MKIKVDGAQPVSAIMQMPAHASACYVLAHGAGAGMNHPFMTSVADGLFARRVATLRFQFPYMERGSTRPDQPPRAHATIRAAVATAAQRVPDLPLFAGGKSFGARMTSQAQAEAPLPSVCGLAFLGFPLHPSKRPSDDRALHLGDVHLPMLFLQGTRDGLADIAWLTPVIARLPTAMLVRIEQADHAFHVPARSGRTDAQVLNEMLDTLVAWFDGVLRRKTGLASRRQ